MAILSEQDFTMVSGDTQRLNFSITTDGTTPKDLTAASSVTWQMNDLPPADAGSVSLVGPKALGSGVSVPNPTGGLVQVTIDPADTASIGAGYYYHELQVVDVIGDVITTSRGTVTMVADAIT